MQITLIPVGNLESINLNCFPKAWVIMLSGSSSALVESTKLPAQENGIHRPGAGQQDGVIVSRMAPRR